jgi:hypothetical protein
MDREERIQVSEEPDEKPDIDGGAKDAGPGDWPEGQTPSAPATSGDPLSTATDENPQPE